MKHQYVDMQPIDVNMQLVYISINYVAHQHNYVSCWKKNVPYLLP